MFVYDGLLLLCQLLDYNFEVLALYLSILILYNSILLHHHTSESNTVPFTPLHLFDDFSYFADSHS